jgi:transcriptional regulator with GAF, ATPase, and Fis domain
MVIDKEQYELILKNWVHEFEFNPHYASELGNIDLPSRAVSRKFLSQVIDLLKYDHVETLNQKAVKPVFDAWHNIIQNQLSEGLSTKETALMIYALKTSLHQSSKDKSNIPDKDKTTLLTVLDILGMLIFEMYTLEKEKLITKQNNQIQYLQNSTTIKKSKLIGSSPAICAVYQAIGLVLENDITVLLQGESGTGKDVIAQTIHDNSKRSSRPYVAINCGAIPNDLLESELFGYEKGAFTGADSDKIGKIELADGGTLFLDEIAELPMLLQVKLLRAIQNREIERVGGTGLIKVDVRIIAATNQNLKKRVEKNEFRLDLYYRLNVFPITIPPLREREQDIIQLANHFIAVYSKLNNVMAANLTEEAKQYLLNYPFEGNVRELENIIQRALLIAKGNPITSTVLAFEPGRPEPVEAPALAALPEPQSSSMHVVPLCEVEKQAIIRALQIKKGNIQQVAKALGVSRTTLYAKIERYQINI